MKQTKHILLMAALLLCSITASAQTGVEIDGIWYYLNSRNMQAEVTYKGSSYDEYRDEYSGSITIPATVTYEGVEYSVTSIRSFAFSGCSSLTAINIPESVTSIGKRAFEGCSSLTSINIPESVTSIGEYAFYGCTGELTVNCNIPSYAFSGSAFTKVTIGDKVTSIGERAFYGCSSFTSITIPEGVTSIGSGAFYGLTGELFVNCNIPSYAFFGSAFTKVTIGDKVTSIGYGAFYECSSLTAITLPEGVTSIGDYAFYGCYSLTSITIPEGVTSIGNYAFRGCRSLTSITLPESVTSIGYSAFYGCYSLTSITIPEGVTSIGYEAFYGCRSLTSITIPEGVTSIGDYAFYGCYSLTSITIPESVTSIGKEAFANCENMQNVYCYAVSVPVTDRSTFNNSYPDYATLHVPVGALVSYMSAAPWKSFGKIVALSEATPDKTSVTITIGEYGSGTYSSEYALDFSEVEGLKAYAATGYNSGTGVVTLTRIMTTQPSIGIFVKGEPGTYEVPVIESSLDHTFNMLVATLAQAPVNANSADGLYANYKYTIKEGETEPKFYQFVNGSTMGAGKAYLQIPTAWLPAGETRSIGLRFDEGEGTTDMEEFTIDNSPLTIIYDLYGRRVTQPVKGSLYIVNGRKVVY